LVKLRRPFDLTLFTIEPDKRWRFVADIHAAECLDDRQAEDALDEFRRQGWYKAMRNEIAAVGGNASALGEAQWAKHVLNVRFRWDNLTYYPPRTFALASDPVLCLTRYQLFNAQKIDRRVPASARRSRIGSSDLPNGRSFLRKGTRAVVCTPEHARMQAKLMEELRKEYPRAHVRREQEFVDVSVRTSSELFLFEIKSDLQPRAVLSETAAGQI